MPYISQVERDTLDPAIHLMAKALIHAPVGVYRVPELAGRLNNVITQLLLSTLFAHVTRYYGIAVAVGILETMKLEMYRRLAAPYEDKKAEENGDVYA